MFDISPYQPRDHAAVRALFIQTNRDLAPPGMETAFEAYIDLALRSEIDRIAAFYDPAAGNGFWVIRAPAAEPGMGVLGTVGLERKATDIVELRRLYVDRDHRRQGIAAALLRHAETEASRLGYRSLVLSTAALQQAAVALYRRSGFTETHREIAEAASGRTVGGGIERLYFQKDLPGI